MDGGGGGDFIEIGEVDGTMVNIDVQTLTFVLGRKSMDMGESRGKNVLGIIERRGQQEEAK